MRLLSAVGKLSGPLYLLLTTLTYILGVGIAKYLGYPLHARVLMLGLVIVILLQAAMDWLSAAFRPSVEEPPEAGIEQARARIPRAALYAAIAALSAAAALAFVILVFEGATIATAFRLGLSMLLILVHSVPPLRQASQQFGELIIAMQIAFVTPSLGFLIEAGRVHRLLSWCGVALTSLLLATLIALELPSFEADLRQKRGTLLTRMGWERGMKLHHWLILASFALLGLSVLFGFSFSLMAPAFLAVPFAIFQVLLLRGIANGARPIWNLVRVNALAVFVLTAYFLTLSLWLR